MDSDQQFVNKEVAFSLLLVMFFGAGWSAACSVFPVFKLHVPNVEGSRSHHGDVLRCRVQRFSHPLHLCLSQAHSLLLTHTQCSVFPVFKLHVPELGGAQLDVSSSL